jgi:hypothetical protein
MRRRTAALVGTLLAVSLASLLWWVLRPRPGPPALPSCPPSPQPADALRATAANFFEDFAVESNLGYFPVYGQFTAAQCRCPGSPPQSCLDCYRWTSSIVLWTLSQIARENPQVLGATYQDRIVSIGRTFLKDSPYSGNINKLKLGSFFVDDMCWQACAYLSTYRLCKDRAFLDAARGIADYVYKEGCRPATSKTKLCNLVWNTNHCKNSDCPNAPPSDDPSDDIWGLLSFLWLSEDLPQGGDVYYQRAKTWLDRLIGANWAMQGTLYTYTSFVFIYACCFVSTKEGDASYIDHAVKAFQALQKSTGMQGGVLKDTKEDTSDSRSFKTIAMLLYSMIPAKLRAQVIPYDDFPDRQVRAIRLNVPQGMCCLYPGRTRLPRCNKSVGYATNWWSTPNAATDCSSAQSVVDCATQCGYLAALSAYVSSGEARSR